MTANIKDIYALSPTQRGMLFHTLYAPESGVYVVSYSCDFEGELEPGLFEQAWGEVMKRHDILRTAFVWEDTDKPVQIVHHQLAVPLDVEDWRNLAEAEQQERFDERLRRQRSAGFDLAQAPLLRLGLIRLQDDRWRFVWFFHHILLDGWSISIVMGELFAIYTSLSKRESLRLPAVRPYRDYIAWQQRQDMEQAEQFWRRMLQGAGAPASLPAAPATAGSGFGEAAASLDAEVTEKLRELARRHQLTLSTFVLGAWGLVLARNTREQAVTVGTTVSGRPAHLPGVEAMVGLFINTLPVRISADPSSDVLTYLSDLQELQASIREYEYCPLSAVQGWSGAERGQSLFDSIVVFENYPIQQVAEQESGLLEQIVQVRSEEQTNYPITLSAVPGESLELSIAYDRALYDHATIERVVSQLLTVLTGMSEDMERTLASVPLLTKAERERMLELASGGTADYGSGLLVHERIAEQAKRTPDAIALLCGDESLTYLELERRASQLASYLQRQGAGPGALVGLYCNRSTEQAVALLAVLKAGAAYVPLDPEYPQERIAYMLSDAKLSLLLTTSVLASALPQTGVRLIMLDKAAEELTSEPIDKPYTGVTQAHPAYVIYTSGSTGTPKGVVISHHALRNHNLAVIDQFGLTCDDRVLQFATISFDAAVEELFPTWLCGAAVVMMPERLMSPAECGALAERHQVTILNLPTAYWHEWVSGMAQGQATLPTTVRAVIVGGERPSPERFAQWLQATAGQVEWFNTYGPTEATVSCTVFRASEAVKGYKELPMGRPLPNTQIYVLDERLEPVPEGVLGEMYIGGAGLAIGYLNRPELDRERFVANPFQTGERLYRTGDLGRYLPDGQLEYGGRTDDQVKIRGFRIELGEIEVYLVRHAKVRDAVVAAREDKPGDKRLVAYVVQQEGEAVHEAELREYLHELLPAYMVPAAIVRIDGLPMTPSGKVDRKALPAPNYSLADSTKGSAAPRNPLEEALCRIWSSVLGVEQVGIDDSFFELGGDSILSIQVVARAAQEGLRVTPRDIFEQRTIAQLSRVVQQDEAQDSEPEQIAGPLPLTPIQHWFFEQDIQARHHWNQAMLLTVRQPVDEAALQQAMDCLLAHHDALRIGFAPAEAGWVPSIAEEHEFSLLEKVDLSAVSEQDRRKELEQSAAAWQQSLSLSGPLVRAVLFNLGDGEPARLLLVVHHLVIDAVSWQILLEDLEQAYEAASRQQQPALPAKTTSFKRWAEGLQRYAASPELKQEAQWWLKAAGAGAERLPTDYPLDERELNGQRRNTESSAATIYVELNEQETQRLLRELPEVYRAQMKEVLLAALAHSVGEWSGLRQVAVDVEGHGREDIIAGIQLSRTVGWFTTQYPVYMDTTKAQGPQEAIGYVKELLSAMPNNGIGFGLLRYMSDPMTREKLSHLPKPEISFNYLGQFRHPSASEEGNAWFGLAPEASGPVLDEANIRSYLLDINAMVSGGRFNMTWTYSLDLYEGRTVEQLANRYLRTLRSFISASFADEAIRYHPADFPLATVTQEELVGQAQIGRHTEDLYAVSPMQEGMLFHTVYSPGSKQYFEQSSFALAGKLDEAAWQQAWQHILNRHAILRTGFIWNGLDKPHQFVLRAAKLPYERLDFSGLSEQEQGAAWVDFLEADRERLFDLGEPPLLRITLIHFGAESYRCVWSFHHILLDGWSIPTLLAEVLASYDTLARGERVVHTPVQSTYRDYIAWLQQQDMKSAEAYWRSQLQGLTSPTALPASRRSPGGQDASAAVSFTVPARSAARMQEMLRHCELTWSTLIQGAWALLLSRYTREEEVMFGVTVAGRPTELPSFEAMIGLFINTLPLRVRIREEETVQRWLQQLGTQMLELRQYEYSPLAQIQGWSEMPNGTPLFDSIVVFQNYPVKEGLEQGSTNELRLHSFQTFEQTNFPITVVALPGEELLLQLLYDPSLFAEESMQRMAEQMATLLREMADRPAQRLGQLNMLTRQERDRLLVEWNATAMELPKSTVLERFEDQARRQPSALAIASAEQTANYGELNAMAERLADALRESGVHSGNIVAICMERSVEQAAAMLGIWKAGAAYMPLDPAYPKERLFYMLTDSQVSVLLTQQHLLSKLPEWNGKALAVEQALQQEAGNSGAGGVDSQRLLGQNDGEASAQPLAYVIYTSGSTGQPKGVEIAHSSLLNLVCWHEQTYQIQPDDRATVLSGTAFDASVWESWPYLATGASLHIPDEDTRLHPEELRNWLVAERITVSFVPTPLAEPMLHLEWPGDTALRALLTGGDRLVQHPPESLPFALYNHYGPSEATVVATAGKVQTRSAIAEPHPPSIGRPIANTVVYLLDHLLRPVPQGAVGELYIGGAGVARGYLHRPELSEERFVNSPFKRGQKLYRTGDLAKYLPGGEIEFIGRNDDQVKIRGMRIELGEIGAALAAQEMVKEAVVVVREDRPGEKRLAAYVVLQSGRDVERSIQAIRQSLKEQLPNYMVPATFTVLEGLPLTPNGKVDRSKLPVPEYAKDAAGYVEPRDAKERSLAGVWEEVLGISPIGIHDNFFELGGDSILSIQVVSRASRAGLRLTPKQIFNQPTIAELAAVAEHAAHTRSAQGPVTGEISLTPIQHWFLEQPLAYRSHWNQAMLLTVRPPLHMAALEQSIVALAVHHDALRMRYVKDEAGWRQMAGSVDDQVKLEEIDLSQLSEAEQSAAISEQSDLLQRSLDLHQGPIMRAVLFHLGPDREARLLLIIHHMAVDAVSWRILLEDLEEAYSQAATGLSPKLPAKTVSYQEWSNQLRAYADSEAVQAEANYWLSIADKPYAPLPVRAGLSEAERIQANTAASFLTVETLLSEEETRTLLQDVPALYRANIQDALLMAWLQGLQRLTGQTGLLLHMESHGREEITEGIDTSRTVGWFTSMYPVYVELAPKLSPGAALKAIKEQLRLAPAQGLSYGALRYLSQNQQLADKLRSLPVPQISFNYLGQFQNTEAEGGVFGMAPEASGDVQHPLDPLAHLLDTGGIIYGGRLQLSASYSIKLFEEEWMSSLIEHAAQSLRELIAACREGEEAQWSPSDFPLARLSEEQIARHLVPARRIEDAYVLAPTQEGMLFHSVYAPESGVYVQQVSFTIQGQLEREAWQRAWERLCASHSVLRTGFIWEGLSEPHQVVYSDVELPYVHEDWQNLSAEEQTSRLAGYLEQDRRQGFDLRQAPLMRLAMFQMEEQTAHCVWTFHHLLLDGWSIPLVLGELLQAYEAFNAGGEPHLASRKPYRDYIAWLQRQDAGAAERYWTARLQGFTAPTRLSVCSARPMGASNYLQNERELSATATEQLTLLARRHNVTLSTVVQGIWALLLARYSGENDVLFGSTAAGRPAELPGVEQMVGLFIHTLPVRVQMDSQQQLAEFFRQLQSELVEQREHEFSPLVAVHGWSEVPRGVNLFDTVVVFENYPVQSLGGEAGDGPGVASSETIDQTNYPLMLVAAPGECLKLRLAYDSAWYEEEAMARMMGHLEMLLEDAATGWDKPCASLRMITEAERALLLPKQEQKLGSGAGEMRIHDGFARMAERSPDRIALVCGEQTMTYAELNERTNRLAHYLQRQGVGPEVLVGVCLERSLELMVAIISILKAGGAYVPLDPSYPVERLSFMIEDSRMSLLVAQGSTRQAIAAYSGPLVDLDELGAELAAESVVAPVSSAGGDNLAYVIYTSGSTGTPKGVAVCHRHVVRLFTATEAVYGFNETDVWTLFHSYAFDFSVWEMWGALLYGGRLVIVPQHISRSTEDFGRLLAEQQVTVLNQTPSAFYALMRVEREMDVAASSLRYIIFGGEALELQALRPWLERYGDQRPMLVNMYGITETTVHVTYRPITRQDVEAESGSLIGQPIADLQLYVLDDGLQPVPIGVPGEMYVEGAGVTRGYLHRPELTAERFLANPYADDPQERLYRTGDLACRMSGGELVYMGRADDQVKIRGFRIELGEIEARLAHHPDVREAIVLARQDDLPEKRLVAYVATDQPELASAELRSYLAARLPDYMVPSAFVFMNAFPMTGNGKTDRKALPAPAASRPELERGYVEPRTPAERKLAAIWAEVIGLERVGVHDNFFELGGHSLIATRLMSRIRDVFDTDIPLRAIFDAPTVEALALQIQQSEQEKADAAVLEELLDELEGISEEELLQLMGEQAADKENE
ncbi:non-ribosomal peptide synthetase [Paenibacillus sp. SYP-B4298]|uniref:non-ribosomal peptide synthetase n=1 Tax=Paenibacillus sp. SYP-B4298 TaxID=2996034 RepID=UPI0022DE3CCE|nr:non-ribosomal peptide synthetase [Paenibacillus sp. SYP-B4298]